MGGCCLDVRFITKKYSSGKKIHEAVPATASLAAV
jgi:hypothetical protein